MMKRDESWAAPPSSVLCVDLCLHAVALPILGE